MTKFDPNAAATKGSGVFGLPFAEDESALIYIPVPWEATTSYGGGASNGPGAILEASHQVDLYDLEVLRPYEAGLFMQPESGQVRAWNAEAKEHAQKIIEASGIIAGDQELEASLKRVNALGEKLNAWVCNATEQVLKNGKIPAIVGGDHSVPMGAFQAVVKKYPGFGILHFDAHSDTRIAYEGFTWSHASIMHNALSRIPELKKIVQVGIRDFCEQEIDFCAAQGARVEIFFDRELADQKFSGTPWQKLAEKIVSNLPENVWVSFDIDGLDPVLCPHTGTPVPGGLSFHEACAVLTELVRSERRIIGFDLNEVAPSADLEDEWDANVGARLLYKLTALTLVTNGKAKFRQAK
ncbi:MAG: agmatinase family protein [Deltaproteobacteria bacterium]|nr:agmatinase family protein [Deltaproteobacteria bacterium]